MTGSSGAPLPSAVDGGAAVRLAAELVRAPGPQGEGGEAAVARVLGRTLAALGWQTRVSQVGAGGRNLIVSLPGDGGPGPVLALAGHLDAVTAGDPRMWRFAPYAGVIDSGRLYGRGAADMRAGLAAMVHAAIALRRSGPYPGELRLLFLADEEGMMAGARQAVRQGALEGVAGVIVCEPEGGEICPMSKGAMRVRVDLTGAMTHGAMPGLGRNPVPVLAELVRALVLLEADQQRQHPDHPTLGRVHLTPTVALAGELDQLNVSPASAVLGVDVRTLPGVDHPSLLAELERACAAAAGSSGVGVRVLVVDDRPPVETPQDHPLVTHLAAADAELNRRAPRYGGVPGTTDGTIFSAEAGVPTVVYGPGGKWIAHQVDEFVEVAEIARYAAVYARAAQLFLGASR